MPFYQGNPLLLTQWHSLKNSDKNPENFGASSKEVVWWLCDKGHEWEQAIFSRRRSKNCPICVNQKVQQGFNDLATLEPELARQWSLDRNLSDNPKTVSAGSNKKFWWVCESGHDFEASISKRVLEGTGCPFCRNKQVLAGFNDLATTNPEIARTWNSDKNLPIRSYQVVAGTAKKFWWVCENGHDYLMSGDKRLKGIGCPVCSNYSIIVGINDLAHTHPELALEWNQKRNSISANDVVAGSHKKFWWVCNNGHEWQASPVNRSNGTGCPSCTLGGFDPESQARIYFISNHRLQARKVGITNFSSERLDLFKKLDWAVIRTWDFNLGHEAQRVEKIFFKWLRTEVGLPPHLDGEAIGRTGGWTETFSQFGPTDSEIVSKLNSLIG